MSKFDDLMNRLFGSAPAGDSDPGQTQEAVLSDRDEAEQDESQVAEPEALAALNSDVNGRPLALPRGKAPSVAELRSHFRRAPSFSNYLPWVEYLPESGCFLLEDGVSVGVVAEVFPIATEGRAPESLEAIRDQIEAAFQDSLPEYEQHPWVVQLFVKDEVDARPDLERMRDYVRPRARETEFTQDWLASMGAHLKAISKPGGLFQDDGVTQTRWRGQTRRTRLVLYRWLGKKRQAGERQRGLSPEQAANQVYDRLAAALHGAGLRLERYDGRAFHRWLLPRFNPRPRLAPDDPARFYALCDYPEDAGDVAWNYDLAEGMLFNSPRGDVETGLWWFDGQPQCCVVVEEMRRAPVVGHLTGEVRRSDGQASNALMDKLPEGTEAVLTIVATPQEPLEDHINRLHSKAVGDSVLARQVREDCETARRYLGQNHKLYQSTLAFYLMGDDEQDLQQRSMELATQLLQVNLSPVDPEDEVAGLNTYLRWLPMNFDPEQDRKNRWYTQFNYVHHLANLAPVFGRGRGTGHPGMTFFNRGGETFSFDPLNLEDRSANAHMLVFGPTGAGKSATLNGVLSQVMAMHRPRLFIIEVGNSFGLLGQYFERKGMSVNQVKLSPGCGARLPPFAAATRLLENEVEERRLARDAADANPFEEAPLEEEEEQPDEERDLLGEMEITARLMITGGDPKEEREFRRADRRMVRDAIYRAAERCREEGRDCMTQDVREALYAISRDTEIPEERQRRAYDMGEAMGLFCDGFDGEVFNRPGTAWPECDVTIIDLAHFAREGYEAQLALAVISVTNMITNLAERDQYSGRPIVQVIDECHLLTVNPLLSPYLVKVGKMGRKLSHWIWMATQNLEDFPAAARKLLNMIEFWLCLYMPPDEIEQVSRFKELTATQRKLMASATKVSKKYTEGVVLSGRLEALFRVVPPSLYLALAGTEGEEKAERMRVMREQGCSELEAVLHITQRLDEARGIGSAT